MSYSNKKIISEVLGVPDNIENVSKKVFNFFVNELEKEGGNLIDAQSEYSYQIKGPFKISDFTVKKIILNLNFLETSQIDNPIFYGMAFHTTMEFDTKIQQLRPKQTKDIELSFKFAVPDKGEIEFNDVLEVVRKGITEFKSSISHELQHAYENFKKPIESSKERARYSAIMSVNFQMDPIKNFLHLLYFTTATENVVRPVEVNSIMKTSKVSKDKFIEFITSTSTYRTYNDAYNFSLDKFKKDLSYYMDRIDQILTKVNEIDNYKTDEEKIDRILELLYVNFSNEIIEGYRSVITSDFSEALFGFSDEKEEMFDKFVDNIQRYQNNPMKFYDYEIKKMKDTSSKMMKKLSKMYTLIGSKKSIKNWDIHDKITKKTQIETHHKY